jgi:hypothetical protein
VSLLVELASQVEVLIEDEDEVVPEQFELGDKTGDEAGDMFFVGMGLKKVHLSEESVDRSEDILPAVHHGLN